MLKRRVFSLVIVLACLLGFSCKVGLGEAVDTVPPTVTITYPPAGSVVRDTFVLAGDCDDDTNVSSVDVYYERTGTYPMPKTKLATVNVTAGDRTWALTIDPQTVDIKDGPYVFYAVSNDSQGRSSGTYTQSIEIDNTAPVLILTKPTSFGSNSPKAYGRSVSIEGTYAESTENRIDKLVVTFYDENGNRLNLDRDNTTFNDITDMSNANPLIIAKYDTATGDPLVEQRHYNYTQLYGNNLDAGAKQFYFTVTAYDKARVFNDPSSSAGTGDGNASLGFYKGTNDILNLINGNKEGYSAFSVKKIQELKNGLDAEYANDDTIRGWLETAWVESAAPTVSTARTALSTEDLTAEKKAKALNFSMNPANYPTFTVSGLDIKTGSEANDDNHVGGYFNYYSGTPLNFAIMPGLDQTKIAVDSVSIYVAEVKPSGVDVANKKLVWTWNPEVAATLSETDRAQKYTPTAAGENADSVTTTVGLDFGKYTGMTGGSHWKFIVEGHDISGDDKTIQDYEDSGYGFNVSVNEQVALIEIDNDEDKTTNTNLSINSVTKKHDSMTFTGSVDRDDVTSMKCEVKVNNQWTAEQTFTPDSHRNWSVTVALPHASDMASNKGLYSVVVTISATNGGGTSQQTRSFSIDNDEPGTSSIVLIDNSTGVEAYKKDAVYYIKKSGSYILQGTTTDNYQVDYTHIKVLSNGIIKDEVDKPAISWYYTPNFSTISAVDGADDVRIEVTAHDKAGNVGGVTNIIIEFDDAAPVAKHEVDAKGKDCVFRIGDGTGGKYSPGTYGKTTTMKIRGNFEDGEGSGVKMIYYQVKQRESDLTLNVSNYSNESIYTGYFAPLATTKTADVSKNLENGTKTTVTIKTGYEAVLTGFEEGNNYLRLVAVDNVGNARLDELTISGQSYSYYSLNVDLTVPNVESNASEAFLTNGDNASIGPITGIATDTGSGIGRIDFYVGDSTYKISADAEVTDTDDPIEYGTEYTTSYGKFTLYSPNESGVCNWTLTLDNSSKWIKNISSGNINVYANVKDKAGLITSAIKVATLAIDTTPPTIQIGAIKDAYTDTEDTEVNGNIDFSGTASDTNALSDTPPVLYYRTSNPGNGAITSTVGWTQIASGDYSIADTNPWNCTGLKTTSAFGSNENKTVWIMASITDQAGNTGYSAAEKLVVNQNSDRPIITFTDLVKTGNDVPWLQRTDLRGTISDDDGISEFKIFIGDSCPANWGSVDPVEVNNGSWTFSAGIDGEKKIWLYVKDIKGTVFISDSGSAKRPYCMYSNTKDSDISAGDYGINASSYIAVNKDTAAPKMSTTLIAIGENGNDYNASTNPTGLKTMDQIQAEGDLQKYQLKSDQYVGGKKSYFVIYVPVFDNFVQTVTAEIKDENNETETGEYNINGGPKPKITLTDTGKTYTKSGDPDTYHYYRGEVIDVSPLDKDKSGVKSVEITVKDQAGNEKIQTCSLTIDNKGPDVKLTTPKESDVVTGVMNASGTSIDGNSYVTETWWMIPNATQGGMDDNELAAESGWSSERADDTTATSWKFRFDGDNNLVNFDPNNIDYTNYVYTLPLYIKSVDAIGNCTIEKFTIKHNPDADRPDVEITYPTDRDYGAGLDYVVLGGTILVTGNVQIPSGTTIPDAVYLQVATGSGSFDSYSTIGTNGSDPWLVENKYYSDVPNKVMGATAAGNAGGSNYSILKGFENDAEKNAWWGIKANVKGTSWNISLNENDLMNPAEGSTTNIWIRACGVNAEGKIGGWSTPVAIRIDANAPVQNASVKKYEGVTPINANNLKAATPTASGDYVADMFIKGDWYLTVEMTDEESLDKVEVKKDVDNGTVTLIEESNYYLTAKYTEDGKAKRMLWVPVIPNAGEDKVTYTVVVTDTLGQGQHITSAKYSINIDNTAPVLGNLKGNGDALAANSIVSEKDYVYTLSGDVEEAGSGFERVFFYFVRPGKVMINPMVTSNAKVTLSGLQTFTVTQGANSYTMYGVKNISGTVQRDKFTPTTASQVTGNQNIKAGGLIFIEGVYRKISSIANNGTITLDTDTGITTATSATAGFPYGMVIDNTSTEKVSGAGKMANPFVLTTDDGDGMPETVNKLGSTYTWDGTIHSVNLPDGPVDMVILAFDKAGNVSGERFSVSVQNNAPRLAKVFLGTDLNHNTTFEDSEFETYNIGAAANAPNGTEAYTLTTANFSTYTLNPRSEWEAAVSTRKAFAVKKDLAVLPEIVGGNGEIKVVFNKNDTITAENGFQTGTAVSSTGELTAPHTITGKYWKFSDLGEDGTKKVSFTFWDSTEECTPGTDSQYAFLRITDLNVDQVDGVDPNVVIDPFFWHDEDDNSLYQNSKDNGHIELESDWTATDDGGVKLTSWDGKGKKQSTYLDSDPKVSGKIVLRGTAYDDTLLETLQFKMTNFDSSAVKTFATYSADNGWTVTKVGGNNPTMASNYYEVTVSEDYLNQNGHKVSWEIAIDTAHISDVAHIDAVFNVIAIDAAGKSSANRTASETSGDATLHRPSYAMDVVPYITDVKRNGDYNTHRSGMGNYPMMREEEENSVTGFNLGQTSSGRLYIASTPTAVTGLSVEDLTVSGNTATFTIPATAVDGYLQYCIHISNTVEIPALNNMNNNAAYTKEDGDSRWYDDRFVKIWQSNANDKFAASYPTYPAMAMGSNGDLYMSYTFYSTSDVIYTKLMDNTLHRIFHAGDQPEQTDIMVNGVDEVNVIYQANHLYGGEQERWCARASGSGSINLYNPSAPDVTTYAKGRYWRFEGTWHNQMLQQLKNAKVVASGTSGSEVYHTIWYDKITKAIKYSNVNKSATQDAYNPDDTSNTSTNVTRPGEIGWVVLDGDADLDDIVQTNQRTTQNYNGGEAKYPNNRFNNSYLNGVDANAMYSIALSKTPAQREAIMNKDENSLRKTSAINANGNYNRYDYTGTGGGTAGYNADCYEGVDPTSTCGEYAAICVTSDGYPVVVYYDVDHKMLKVARGMNTNPKGMNTQNQNNGASAWRIQQVALTNGHLGNDASYVSAVIDSAGYLHIAFQNSRGELIYTRSTNTTAALTLTQGFTFDGSVIVDTNGTWASITVDSNDLPQIAYMANTSGYDTLKLAYPVNATWKTATNWETMYAPMNAKSSNVKTCVVARPSGKTGGQVAGLTTYWKTGIGFATSEDYRVMKYIGSGAQNY